MKKLIQSIANGSQDVESLMEHQLVKRIKSEHLESTNAASSDSSDEGIHCHPSPNIDLDNMDDLRHELIHIRKTVDRERKLRMSLEEQVKSLETQLYPERVKEIAQSVQNKFVHHGISHHHHQLHSESGSIDEGSETEDAAAVASLVEDENVIAETIEIETQDPEDLSHGIHHASAPTTIVIQGPSGAYSAPIHVQAQPTISYAPTATSTTSFTNSNTRGKKGGANRGSKGAIALPIDVPFIGASPSASQSTPGTITVQIVNSSNGSNEGGFNVSNTSRHNLETIVEAIRHLEGDHLFKDEEVTVDYGEEEVEVETESIPSEEMTEEIVIHQYQDEPMEMTTSKPVKVLKMVAPHEMGVSRVIKCIPVSSGGTGSRPGVIVAKKEPVWCIWIWYTFGYLSWSIFCLMIQLELERWESSL